MSSDKNKILDTVSDTLSSSDKLADLGDILRSTYSPSLSDILIDSLLSKLSDIAPTNEDKLSSSEDILNGLMNHGKYEDRGSNPIGSS